MAPAAAPTSSRASSWRHWPAVAAGPAKSLSRPSDRKEIPLAPIVVTENPADEEFWELQSALPPGAIGGHPGTTVRDDGVRVAHQLIFGARPKCEELRDSAHRNGVTILPCLGPHYLKRTGPPEEIAPRRGYNAPGFNAR